VELSANLAKQVQNVESQVSAMVDFVLFHEVAPLGPSISMQVY
jgi:hypothetical protein